MKKISLLIFLFIHFFSNAQQVDWLKNSEKSFDKSKNKYSFKYDLLSEILQVGIDKGVLKSNENEVNLKSTLYGLMVLFNKDYEIDKNYSRLKMQRNLEIGGSMQLNNEDQKINGFSLALKYAIINNRDLSEGKDYNKIAPQVRQLQQKMASNIAPVLEAFLNDSTKSDEEKELLTKFLHDNSNIKDFNLFFSKLKPIVSFTNNKEISRLMANMQTDLEKLNAEYDSITKVIEKRPLLTFSTEGKSLEGEWEFAKFKLEYSKGLGFVKDDQNPWDIYFGAFFDITRDTVSSSKKLNRTIGTLKGGINHVLIKKSNNQSFVEVLGGFEYNSIFDGKYIDEKKNVLSALFNFTFRIAPNLYLPLELKYDPDKEKFLGLVRMKWDMIRNSE
ncbi:MAG TPA: hypothetical protein VF476_18420, partial [Chitinophagaceae bacterium]